MIVQVDEQAQVQQIGLEVRQVGLAFQQGRGKVGPVLIAKRPGGDDHASGRLLAHRHLHTQLPDPDTADAAKGKAVLSFFDWAYKNGDAAASGLNYVPLPQAVKDMVRKQWSAIAGPDGKPVYAP